LRDVRDEGICAEDLAQKTGVDVVLLQRMMHYFIAIKVVSSSNSRFRSIFLSDRLAADNYQRSIDFLYDVARPSFNRFPDYFKKINYRLLTSLSDGPF
jgi:hypothetical protein